MADGPAGVDGGASGQFSIFPLPPSWFEQFHDGHDILPPVIPKEGYPMFGAGQGNPILMGTSASRIPTLDRDTLLFEERLGVDGQLDPTLNYNEVIAKLIGDLEDELLLFLDLLSVEGHPTGMTPQSRIPKISKIFANIHHVLNRLREWEALENVANIYKDTIEKERSLVRKMDAVTNRVNSF